jgi:MoxR-like ATPase
MNANSQLSEQLKEKLTQDSNALRQVLEEMGQVIVGQSHMTRALLIGLLQGGHVLLEGLPGLAKTLAVKTLAQVLQAKFHRVQFTPDLLPSDLIGTLIYKESTGEFSARKGPIFTNLLLADEINRAPAKVQSALLEAMAEKQVTIGDTTYPLEAPFLVLATQNPIEQEGTYPLPEAQLDRFLFKLKVGYPSREEERMILERMGMGGTPKSRAVLSPQNVLSIRSDLHKLYVDPRIKEYILRLVFATRKETEMGEGEALPEGLREVRNALQIGASPRATLFLLDAARTVALLEGRYFVIPEDIKEVAADVLRHRLILTFDAQARDVSADAIIQILLETVTVP